MVSVSYKYRKIYTFPRLPIQGAFQGGKNKKSTDLKTTQGPMTRQLGAEECIYSIPKWFPRVSLDILDMNRGYVATNLLPGAAFNLGVFNSTWYTGSTPEPVVSEICQQNHLRTNL